MYMAFLYRTHNIQQGKPLSTYTCFSTLAGRRKRLLLLEPVPISIHLLTQPTPQQQQQHSSDFLLISSRESLLGLDQTKPSFPLPIRPPPLTPLPVRLFTGKKIFLSLHCVCVCAQTRVFYLYNIVHIGIYMSKPEFPINM